MTTIDRVAPEVSKIFMRKGEVQVAIQATVTYPGEEPMVVEFVGSRYGGPVLMVTEHGEIWVTEPGRFGTFGKNWVLRFYE